MCALSIKFMLEFFSRCKILALAYYENVIHEPESSMRK
jgi:hypothetical protein